MGPTAVELTLIILLCNLLKSTLLYKVQAELLLLSPSAMRGNDLDPHYISECETGCLPKPPCRAVTVKTVLVKKKKKKKRAEKTAQREESFSGVSFFKVSSSVISSHAGQTSEAFSNY